MAGNGWNGMGTPVVAMAGVAQEAWLTLVSLGEDEDERNPKGANVGWHLQEAGTRH